MPFCYFLTLVGCFPALIAISHDYNNENTPLNIIMLLAFPEEMASVKRTPQLRESPSSVSSQMKLKTKTKIEQRAKKQD